MPVYTRVLTRVQLTFGRKPSSNPWVESIRVTIRVGGRSHWRRIRVESGLEPSCKQGYIIIQAGPHVCIISAFYFLQGPPGLPGEDGVPGTPGRIGRPGKVVRTSTPFLNLCCCVIYLLAYTILEFCSHDFCSSFLFQGFPGEPGQKGEMGPMGPQGMMVSSCMVYR